MERQALLKYPRDSNHPVNLKSFRFWFLSPVVPDTKRCKMSARGRRHPGSDHDPRPPHRLSSPITPALSFAHSRTPTYITPFLTFSPIWNLKSLYTPTPTDEEVELLQGTSLHAVTVQWKTQVEADYRELGDVQLPSPPPGSAGGTVSDALEGFLTKEGYLWALGTVRIICCG